MGNITKDKTDREKLIEKSIQNLKKWSTQSTPPEYNPPICTIYNPSFHRDPLWKKCQDELELNDSQQWQHNHILYALRKTNLIRPDAVGLSIACGHEKMLYYLTHHIGMVHGCDIYDGQSGFQDEDMQNDPDKFAPFEYCREKLKISQGDVTRSLPYDDSTFDFAWSVSAIEHFGSDASKKAAVKNISRVLKPGGMGIFSTEFIISHEKYRGQLILHKMTFDKQYFTHRDILDLIASDDSIELVEDIQFDAYKEEDFFRERPPVKYYSSWPVSVHGFMYCAIVVAFRKKP